ncbi:Gnt-I system low-affinity gluconate transporter [Orenia metallireducens]|uniref:Gnt-I system low-affinity gluconate transporter n=1 Tax=Orenia metallireducens TaxID=1413210 RepID=A0A285GCR7_9FIRM|nr:gluconate:H+ symporter [Orenia metallireducens]PRX32486.1 Gnt-I system low-affinity gluconate transporter [Orenia metallireducens]SNY21103.1 Gnt-I system low-affinity gluconate transporter [Orenia metallireducens]
MAQSSLILVTLAAIGLLLFLVLKLRIQAFISLLITSMFVGIATGMPLNEVIKSIQSGMGGTLGFVATVVGLGAIFGQILEASGGAEALATTLIKRFGKDKASWALVIAGFLVAIPVFFDVGFIILVPIVYALAKDTKKSVLYYGIPLLAGLAVTHTFIPPTPGPIAVAEIVGADLGWVIFFGALIGFPTAILAGPVFGKYIGNKIHVDVPEYMIKDAAEMKRDTSDLPSFRLITSIIAVPLGLILANTLTDLLVKKEIMANGSIAQLFGFLGHPFVALTIATLLAIYLLGTKRGFTKDELLELSTKALGPAGLIILVTGAGGVFKQMLIDSGVGTMLANTIASSSLPPIVLAYILAVVVRITQGSATVSMITAAGIIAPVMEVFDLSAPERALIVLTIASGATILSHVNDSGFWLVGRYFGLDEKQTLKSWTVMESIISIAGFGFALVFSFFV